ncbi:uncharacterized protein METZ01_LOCUS493516 [marine metagenome]|uniref:Single-stranded DNA-binding protein n=1 Tax=marine metagenome TaxID=408172 RepID=A0A383D837_9ZZZZ
MAARGVNKVIILGNLGGDPDMRYMPNGTAVCTMTIYTNESWKDRETGEKREKSEKHSVVMFAGLAEIAGEYLKQGSQVYIEGKLETQKWEDKQNGITRWKTQIKANEMHMLGPKNDERTFNQDNVTKPDSSSNEFVDEEFDDDIPF